MISTTICNIIRPVLLTMLVVLLAASCSGSGAPAEEIVSLTPLERQGLDLFRIHCASCHETGANTIIVGPSLKGIATSAGTRIEGLSAENYLRISILRPYDYIVEGYSETMPPDFGKRLTGEEFDAVLAYIMTLE